MLRCNWQLPEETWRVYVVLAAGERTGFSMAGLLTPVVGDQLNEVALVLKPVVNEALKQMLVSLLLAELRNRLFVNGMVTFEVVTQPPASVILAW